MKRLFYCDHHEIPLPAGHRFPKRKYRMLRDKLAGAFDFVEAPLATPESISSVNDPGYVEAFLRGSLDAAAVRRIGFPWSQGLVRRTLASVGGTLAAAQEALDSGWGGTLAGGTHHAFPDYGAGFCVFNDFAVAIASLRLRSAVIDLDVHQGDGTAAFFERDPEVFTLSLHGAGNFPFRKQRSTLDIALVDGAGDEAYLEALEAALPRVAAFVPRVVFYQSGVDGLAEDALGRLNLTVAGLKQRDELVFDTIRRLGVPVVVTLGGGYANPIERTVDAHAQTFTTAARILAERRAGE